MHLRIVHMHHNSVLIYECLSGSLSVGFRRSSNSGFIAGSTSHHSEFNNTNTCMNTHTHSHSHSNMPRHTHSNTHPSMAGHTQTHTRPSVSNFSVATEPFLDSSTADTQHYIGKNTAFSLSVPVNHGEILTSFFLFDCFFEKSTFKVRCS